MGATSNAMTSIGTGYDLASSTYSPDGRIFQVEYANKAVENAGTVIALRCKDGVIIAVEKLVSSKLLAPGANKRIASVDHHAGVASAGLLADGRHIAKRGRELPRHLPPQDTHQDACRTRGHVHAGLHPLFVSATFRPERRGRWLGRTRRQVTTQRRQACALHDRALWRLLGLPRLRHWQGTDAGQD